MTAVASASCWRRSTRNIRAATTATVLDKAPRRCAAMRWQPALRTLPPYHDDPLYIDALAKDSRGASSTRSTFEPEVAAAELPRHAERTLHLGDPYHCHCRKTARLLERRARAAGLADRHHVPERASAGPSGSNRRPTRRCCQAARRHEASCGRRAGFLRRLSRDAGRAGDPRAANSSSAPAASDYASLACLNASEAGMAMLEALVRRELAGWIAIEVDGNAFPDPVAVARRAQLFPALGRLRRGRWLVAPVSGLDDASRPLGCALHMDEMAPLARRCNRG